MLLTTLVLLGHCSPGEGEISTLTVGQQLVEEGFSANGI